MTKAYTRHNRNRSQGRYNIYLPVDLHERIEQRAKYEFISMSEWIEQACEEKLERDGQQQRRLRRA
jgi:predicted HicB family RNase H-like nuclease